MTQVGSSPIRQLARVAPLMLGVLGALALGSLVVVDLRTTRYEAMGRVMDVAGRQRLLTERVARTAEVLVYENSPEQRDAIRTELLETTDLLGRSHRALVERRGVLGLTGQVSPEARSLYFDPPYEVDVKVHQYVAAGRALAKASEEPVTPEDPRLRALLEMRQPLLAAVDQVVKQYDRDHQAATESLRRLALGVLVATVAAVGAAWVLVFRPMLGRIQEDARILGEREARFRALTENANDAIIEWNSEGRILYANPRTLATSGLPPEEYENTYWYDHLDRGHPDDVAAFGEALRTAVESGSGSEVSFRLRHRDGGWRWLELKFQPFRAASGETHLVSVGRDVTERREAEALRRLTNDLRRANRELDEFASVTSHALQEPLRKIVSFGALLRDDLGLQLPEEARRDLDFITDAARRMQGCVSDLLALSRAGTAPLTRERVPVDKCVDRALEALELRIRETKAQISRDSLPEVVADPTLLTDIYQNLISNALKFVGSEPPVIRLTAGRRSGEWVLGVRDNGIGLRTEETEQVFEPFRRLQAPGTYEGTGIGLAICRKAVERHGGRIWVVSEPGRGSHFQFTLGG